MAECGKPLIVDGAVVARCEIHGNLDVICENAALTQELAAVKAENALMREKCEYIRSAYCDDLDTAKQFADAALTPPKASEKNCGEAFPRPGREPQCQLPRGHLGEHEPDSEKPARQEPRP